MKKLSVCFVLCSILWTATCSAAQADTIEVESSISAVNVFFQGARITRAVSLNLSTGRHVLLVRGLPLDLDPNLIKVNTPSRLKILAVSHKVRIPSQKSMGTELAILEEKKTTLEDEIEWLKAKKQIFDEEEALLTQNTELKKADGEKHTLGVREAADFYRERLTEIAKLKFDNTMDIRKAQKQIKQINAKVNSLLAGTKVPQTELLLFVEASSIVSEKLDVEYFTKAAGWEPLYDFRFDAVNKPLELVYNANVYQFTGEDWNEVDLSLTEGLPKQKAELPEFDRWYITRKPSPKPKASISNENQTGSGTLKGTLTDAETGEPLPFVNIILQQGNKQVTGSATDFDGNYTIKPIPSGVYDVLVSYVGYNAKKVEGVRISSNKITFTNIELYSGVQLETFEVVEYTVPLIQKDGGSSGGSVSVNGLRRMPGRNLSSYAQIAGGTKSSSYFKLFIDESPSISSPRISYSVDYKYSVPSSGEDRLLTIKTEKVPVAFLYRAIPKVDTDVYLLARITDWGNLQLLSGKSTIYFQGAYSGESTLDAESVKDTLEIALGRDENILLERRLNQDLSKEQSFGSKVKRELHWEIEVRSNKSHPVMLELIDQVPLSDNRNVNVEIIDIGDAKSENDSGKLTWELRLEPNSSQQLDFSYELKYPESALVYN
ncbi:DUF4139 domain-containing protein [Cryomorphaceae bacterium 1068]|nr:DUF4139 domain-containing protein [Cryomorphaceae bacterium 1068]